MRRLIFIALWLALVVGAVMAIRTGLHQRSLLAELRRLHRIVGDLPIKDPTKISVLAIETGGLLSFAWRIYVPSNPSLQYCRDGTSWNSFARNFGAVGVCEFCSTAGP